MSDMSNPNKNDLFPLTPRYPLRVAAFDRKQRFRVASGRFFVRPEATDLEVFDLEGLATPQEMQTLLGFYADHAAIGCVFRDGSFRPARSHAVKFVARPQYVVTAFENVAWNVQLTGVSAPAPSAGPASGEDRFPLTPRYPLRVSRIDRKQRVRVASGQVFVRSEGDDLEVFELEGLATSAQMRTLLDFYEAHARVGCTFRDATFDPARHHRVQFAARPRYEVALFQSFVWSVQLVVTGVV